MSQPIVNTIQRNVIRQRARQIRQHFQAMQTASWKGEDLMPYLQRINQFEAKLYEFAADAGVHVAPDDSWGAIFIKSLDTGKVLTVSVT